MYAGTSTFSSKTEHIMSRYRPIAPKPIAPKPEGTDPSDPQTSSSLSLDKGSSKLSETRARRSRKRQTDSSSASTRNAKKASVALEKSRNGAPMSKTPVPASFNRHEASSANTNKEVPLGLTPILSESVAPVFGSGGLQRFNESADLSGRSVLSLAARSPVSNGDKSYGGVRESSAVRLALPVCGGTGVAATALLETPLRGTATGKDAAFMTRAAASTPEIFFGEGSGKSSNRGVGGFLGGFGEMFQGLPAAQGTMPEPGRQTMLSIPSRETGGCKALKFNESLRRSTFVPLPYASASYGGESEVCSGEEVAESTRTTTLVTLSLLPDTPIHGPSTPSESSFPSPWHTRSKSSLPSSSTQGLRFDCNDGTANQADSNTNLTMFSKGEWLEEECRDSTGNKGFVTDPQNSCKGTLLKGTLLNDSFMPVGGKDFVEEQKASGRTHAIVDLPAGSNELALNGPVVDSYHLDQVYATSSDATMLTDEQNRILWSNSAFRRAATEKTSGKMQSAGPHIDPLGIPTQLAVLMFQPPYHAPKCKAVLWGFLKKFIFQEQLGPCFADTKGLGEWKSLQAQSHGQCSYDSRTASFDASTIRNDSVVYEGDLSLGLSSSSHKVIAPQPIRAVGSTICLESITKVNQLGSPMVGTLETYQEQFEKLPLPTVITDSRHTVRWVNTAYKKMVGQPECAWLSSTVGGNVELEVHSPNRLAGDVLLICATELPVDAVEFSCEVCIQWTKSEGGKSSLVFPTEVIRLDDNSLGSLFVWKFDMFNGQAPPFTI